jgi:hypothetical protein
MRDLRLLGSALAVLLAGCSDELPTQLQVDEFKPTPATAAVTDFVADQNLPLLRWTHQVILRDNYECFYTTFGEPQDCPSGCIYEVGYGIRVGDRVGWLGFEYLSSYEPQPESYFDVTPSDAILFDFDTWLAISNANWSIAWEGLVPTLARDPDTDRAALLSIAAILYTHHSAALALDIVHNPVVATEVEILTLISELPVVGPGDIYSEARDIALRLLGGLVSPGAS